MNHLSWFWPWKILTESSQLADTPSSAVEGQDLGREQAEHTAQGSAGRQPSSRELDSSRDYLKTM